MSALGLCTCSKLRFLLFVLLFSTNISLSQDLNIFIIYHNGFVSLSDVDNWKGVPHADILPVIDGRMKDVGYVEQETVEITGKYRSNFLKRTEVAETDSLFIYSYLTNKIKTFAIAELKAIAHLTYYISPDECPCPVYYYQFGFDVDLSSLNGYEASFTHTLVAVGKHNPFVIGELEPMSWEEIPSNEYPSHIVTEKVGYYFGNGDSTFTPGQCYKHETDSLQFYIQKHMKEERQIGLRLIVVEKSTQVKRFEQIYTSGESTSFASLNSQWFGKLFRNKPFVIFGFLNHSFGCPGINFIDENVKGITINCDNRH